MIRFLQSMLLWLDLRLVRGFGFSLVSRMVCGQAGVPPVRTFVLTTTGRRSRQPQPIPIFYFRHGPAYVVIGSKGGAPEHPAWFLNLQADPNARIEVDGRELAVRARIAEGAERAALWDAAAREYPPYIEYQRNAGARTIAVVVLDPA
ncbi:MAG: nitroreductase/quinone reductase family protein [Gammaproteobacteria bacterium]